MKKMKKIIIITISILSIGCKAQGTTPTIGELINITDKNGVEVNGAYYKDLDNLLDPFQGIYVYSSGNKILKIHLLKKVMQYNGKFYEDLIIGEYQYIEDGIEKINTLPQINIVYADQRIHEIHGNRLLPSNKIPKCNECDPAELRLRLGFIDPIRHQYGSIIVRKINVGGNAAIKIHLKMEGTNQLWIEGQPQPTSDFTVPGGEYILIKE